MKRIIFSGLLITGLLFSVSGYSQRFYGHRGGFGLPHPRVWFNPIPAPVICAPAYAPAYQYGYDNGYAQPYYYPQYRRPYRYARGFERRRFYRRW